MPKNKKNKKAKKNADEVTKLAKEARQKKVFDLRLKGLTRAQISEMLHINPSTVERDEKDIIARNRKWLVEARKKFDADTYWMDQINELKKAKFELWVIAADNDKDRVKAIEAIERMQESLERRMRAAGITTTSVDPEKMITDTIRIIHEHAE